MMFSISGALRSTVLAPSLHPIPPQHLSRTPLCTNRFPTSSVQSRFFSGPVASAQPATLAAARFKHLPLARVPSRAKSTTSYESDDGVDVHVSDPTVLDRSSLSHIGFRVIPQGTVGLVERFGKYNRNIEPGLNFLIPFVDRIKYSFALKRVSFSVKPQEAFTKDNVKVRLGGDIIIRIVEPLKAAYDAEAPFSLATIYAQAAMRNAIGELTLDELLNQRETINKKVFDAVNKKTMPYGLECHGYEIKGLKVPSHIEEEMARQVTSERKRRETVLNSEGEREAAINKATGLKRAAELESEGKMTAQINEAKGIAEKRLIEANAEAEALALIGRAIRENTEAAANLLASETLKTWGHMLGHSNTIIVPPDVSPISALLPQALAAFSRSTEIMKTTQMTQKSAETNQTQPQPSKQSKESK